MIKIISKKEYERLTKELKKAQESIRFKDSQIEKLSDMLAEDKSDPAFNQGKPFCSVCKYSYLDTMHSVGDHKVYGCWLTATCDSFCR